MGSIFIKGQKYKLFFSEVWRDVLGPLESTDNSCSEDKQILKIWVDVLWLPQGN